MHTLIRRKLQHPGCSHSLGKISTNPWVARRSWTRGSATFWLARDFFGPDPQWGPSALQPGFRYTTLAGTTIIRRDGLNYARPSAPDSGWEVYNPPKGDAQEPGVEAPTGDAAAEPETTPSIPAWREPANKAQLYPAGVEVTHKGKQWRSATGGNRAEPGTDNSGEEIREEA